jgi:hypothetical protein
MARRIAASTFRSWPAEIHPSAALPVRRSFETVRICSHFTNVVSRRPLVFAGSILTWNGTRLPFMLMSSKNVLGSGLCYTLWAGSTPSPIVPAHRRIADSGIPHVTAIPIWSKILEKRI